MPDEEQPGEAPDAKIEGSYLLLVGGLLLIIGMALGWLWLTERTRRIDAEHRAIQMQVERDSLKKKLDALVTGLSQKGRPRKIVLPGQVPPANRPRD